MLQKRRPDDTRRLLRLRHTDEWVGLLVVLALALFFGAIFEAGVLKRWLNPDLQLRIMLPQNNFGGLASGADIEVMGTHAGDVNRIVLNPDGEMYALATIERQTAPFISRDSKAIIRLRYAVAGAAYIDITRGKGPPMDWDYAVINATVQPNPADIITATLNQVRAQLLPTLDHAEQAMAMIDQIIAGMKAGHGSVGRLLTDDTLIRQAEATLTKLKGEIAALNPILGRVPPLLNQTHAILGNFQSVSRDAAQATPQLPAIARNFKQTTANLPALVTQAQATTEQLQKLLVQLRGLWLLGGSGTPKPEPLRLPPRDVRP